MTLDDLIQKLTEIREKYGGGTPCVTPGFDESGYDPVATVEAHEFTGPLDEDFGHTGRLEMTANLSLYDKRVSSYHGTKETRICVLINF